MTVTTRHVKALELTMPGWEFDLSDLALCNEPLTDHLCASLERAWLGMGYVVAVYQFPDGFTEVSLHEPASSGPPKIWVDALPSCLEAHLDAAVEVMVALGRMEKE